MKLFDTLRRESFRSRLLRWRFNFFPAYRRTSARIAFISGDWKEVHVKLSLTWTTRNIVGTVFGGSLYGALDPIYMTQLMKILGPKYVVWDKAATIKFIKPVRKTVRARFVVQEALVEEIKNKVRENGKYEIDLPAEFQDETGTVYAAVTKLIYIADKEYYQTKKTTS